MIRIQSLHKYFNKGRQNQIHVINDISLELPERGMVAIFGKSGCGKTTLLNVIGGLDGFASGQVTIEGQDVRQDTDRLRNQYVGYIFQNYNLNKVESCFDNVANALRLCGMSDPAEIEERVMAALSNVGMDKYRNRTPDTLSGGQQQRIAIARAIVKNPRIILADEPTGNLDEANTVMIMNLLKAIAKDHLVLLVTHEVNLVDYYCDTVIELNDGQVVGVRNNESANGFAAKDKNDVYLGELEKSALSNGNACIEYYGDAPDEPIRLKIVNNGGKLYLRVDSPAVQLLDETSEVKLREGVYQVKESREEANENIDMSKLPPVQGTRFGHLFSFASSVKSGYVANFKKHKKGKKVLRGCMCLFAAVLVFMSAVFGTAFADILNARDSYNHNVFYVYTPDEKVSATLNGAVGSAESGIDFVRLSYDIPRGDQTVKFLSGFFETFSTSMYDNTFRANAVFLDASLAKDLPVVEGKTTELRDEEIIITTSVADTLLKNSSLGYIKEYDDLLGLITNTLTVDGKNLRIAGVVDSDETAIYLSSVALAKYVMRMSNLQVTLDEDVGMEVKEGETVLVLRDQSGDVKYPKAGETVFIGGRELKVARLFRCYIDYSEWLNENGIKPLNEYEYFRTLLLEEQPTLKDDKDALNEAISKAFDERIFEYYEYRYEQLDDFLADYYFFEKNYFELWLAVEKKVEYADLLMIGDEYYYKALQYKKQNGVYPTQMQMNDAYDKLPSLQDLREKYYTLYEQEFYNGMGYQNYLTQTYVVSEADYVAFSAQLGKTDDSALTGGGNFYYDKEIEYEYAMNSSSQVIVDTVYGSSSIVYTVVHSNDPEKTAAFLNSTFPDLETGFVYLPAILSPDQMFETILDDRRGEIIVSLITMGVILLLMSLCMYFIMRSSLMNRIKEVGIYRAIGVSKKNLTFKFLIEAVVLTTLTVLIGYLITSAFIFTCLGASPLMESMFFYPVWLAAILLVILYALCLFCGTLPILGLLRRKPSEILAKYDI